MKSRSTNPNIAEISDLSYAVENSDLEYVVEFFDKFPHEKNIKLDGLGNSILHKAVRYHQTEIVRFLLEKGCDVNIVTNEGVTPLHIAAENKDSIEVATMLIHYGADVNAKTKHFSNTPLHKAALVGNDKFAELLVSHKKINPSLKNYEGTMPLDLSFKYENFGLSYILLKGLDYKEEYLSPVVQNPKFLKKMLSGEIDPSFQDENGNNILHFGATGRNRVIIKKAIENGTDFNKKNNKGNTPLHIAASLGYMDIIVDLIRSGCDVSLRNNDGHLPYEMTQDDNIRNLIDRCSKETPSRSISDATLSTATKAELYKS